MYPTPQHVDHYHHQVSGQPRLSIRLIRGQRGGYGFEISVADCYGVAEALTLLEEIETELKMKYTGGNDDTAE